MIEITFDEIGEHIEQGDIKEWLAELKVINATKGMLADDRKTEPTCSKMEQVEYCDYCKIRNKYWYGHCDTCDHKPKDEPQTDCAWKEPK